MTVRKDQSRRNVRDAAFALIGEHGFANVTVEEIAAAAGVSRRTFFNYFADKESVIFDPDPGEEYLWQLLLSERPAGQQLWDSLRELVLAYSAETMSALTRQVDLMSTSPELRSCSRQVSDRFWDAVQSWAIGAHGDSVRVELQVNAARSVINTTLPHWEPATGVAGMHALFSDAFALFAVRDGDLS
jgi:AcrR family transcriptional regulator